MCMCVCVCVCVCVLIYRFAHRHVSSSQLCMKMRRVPHVQKLVMVVWLATWIDYPMSAHSPERSIECVHDWSMHMALAVRMSSLLHLVNNACWCR